MVLHPQARRAVEQYAAAPKVSEPGFDIDAERRRARAEAAEQPREPVGEVLDVDADGVPCRLYRPERAGTRGPDVADCVVVHVHGGGFVFNDVDVHDAAARRLANRTGMAVLSVDYRRPPEHRFPAAPDDVDVALRWASRTLPGPTYLHGDSAGANLALVAALRNRGLASGLVLIYPFLDPSAGFPSYDSAAEGFDREEAAWYWRQYAASEEDLSDPDLAPLRSDRLHTLPPTMVVTAEHDPLRDEGEHLSHLLAEAGVEVVASRALGQIHGFWRHVDQYPAAEPLTRQVAGFLRMLAERDV